MDVFWDARTRDFLGWYVNLQKPLTRTPIGWDTRDHVLDVWVESDGRWRWKDVAELEQRVRDGSFSPAEAQAVRAEGQRVAAQVESWSAPFCDGWDRWRPDPEWPFPALPDDWDRLW